MSLGELDHSPLPTLRGEKGAPWRRGALHCPREAGMARVLQPPPLACRDPAHAESGELGMGLVGAWSLAFVRAAPGRGLGGGAGMSGPPGSGASLPDPG